MKKIENDESIIDYYVCTNCFHKIRECNCMYYPISQLYYIDLAIQEHVRILNEKGYNTTASCESHNPNGAIYIMFSRYDGIEGIELPEGFTGTQYGTAVEHIYNGKMSMEDFEIEKKKYLDILLEWCKSLPKRLENNTW